MKFEKMASVLVLAVVCFIGRPEAASRTTVFAGGARIVAQEALSHQSIVVDGNLNDWFAADIAPIITDPLGDAAVPGGDVLGLRITDDGISVFFLLELASPLQGSVFLDINIDGDPATGCGGSVGFGFEYSITFHVEGSTMIAYIGDARDCSWESDDFPGALHAVATGNFIEASVPIKVLTQLHPNPPLKGFHITCRGNDSCDGAQYTLTAPAEEHVGGSVSGLFPLRVVCSNKTTGKQVKLPAGTTKFDCEDAGLVVSPGDKVTVRIHGSVPEEPQGGGGGGHK